MKQQTVPKRVASLICFVLFTWLHADGATVTYHGPPDDPREGLFGEPTNWSPVGIPDAADTAGFAPPTDEPATVRFDADAEVARARIQGKEIAFESSDPESPFVLYVSANEDVAGFEAEDLAAVVVKDGSLSIADGTVDTSTGPFSFDQYGWAAQVDVLVAEGGNLLLDSGSQLKTESGLTIGNPNWPDPQQSSVTVSDGAKVSIGLTTILSPGQGFEILSPEMESSLSVSGSGSEWNSSGGLVVGFYGNGAASFREQATANFGDVTAIGWGWDARIETGARGDAQIETGAVVTSFRTTIGVESGAIGTMQISGEGSQLITNERLQVGLRGEGTLEVSDGGAVSGGEPAPNEKDLVILGWEETGVGRAIVTGAGSSLGVDGQLQVGIKGHGELTISDTAVVVSSAIRSPSGIAGLIGAAGTGSGEATISGESSKWTMSDGALVVGLSGSGSVHVVDGGTLESVGGSVAQNPGSSGNVIVSGPGSSWTSTAPLRIGEDESGNPGGGGSLTVSTSGEVTAPDILIGPSGEIQGNGLLTGNVRSRGTTIADSSDTLQIEGRFAQLPAGHILLRSAGPCEDSSTALAVSGQVELDGRLSVVSAPSCATVGLKSVTVLAGHDVTGTFAELPPINDHLGGGQLGFGQFFEGIDYSPDSVVVDIFQAAPGDSNGDREFNSSDLVQVFQAGRYEDGENDNASWTEGDWNSDHDFTSSDLVLAFQGGLYEKGLYWQVARPVSEPNGTAALVLALATLACRVRFSHRGRQNCSWSSKESLDTHKKGDNRRVRSLRTTVRW